MSWTERFSKGSDRLRDEARHSTRAQGYRRGQNSTQRQAIRPIYNRARSQFLAGYTIPFQLFDSPIGMLKPWLTPSGQRATSTTNNNLPSLNTPGPTTPIQTRMPWQT